MRLTAAQFARLDEITQLLQRDHKIDRSDVLLELAGYSPYSYLTDEQRAYLLGKSDSPKALMKGVDKARQRQAGR